MAGYIIVCGDDIDWGKFKEYARHASVIIAKFGGHIITRGNDADIVTLEGDTETSRIFLIEFPTKDDALAYYISDDYHVAKKIRKGGGDAKFIVFNGFGDNA